MAVQNHIHEETTTDGELKLYCTVHPNIETNLRCNRCGRPMCTKCAVQTPVGYRCRECVREQQNKYFNAQILDYIIAATLTLVLSYFAAAIIARIGWFFFAIFLAPAAGGLIGRAAFTATRKRRGRYTTTIVGTAMVLGALPLILFNPLAVGIYIFLATGAAVGQFGLRL